MKKLLLILLVIGAFTSCGDKNAYTLKGTLTGKADTPDSVMVHLYEDGQGKVALDSTRVQGGKFEFKGVQESPAMRFVGLLIGGMHPVAFPVVIETGNIEMIVDEDVKVSGSPLNDKMQDFSNMTADKYKKMSAANKEMSELTDDDPKRAEADEKLNTLSKGMAQATKAMIKQNADNPLGYFYFTSNVLSLENVSDMKEVMELMPASKKEDPMMVRISGIIEAKEATEIGKKFVDVKGLAIDGKEVSLSDYAGKGKFVLIDFWASWCGPCIQELPNVKKAYDKYKNKGFEIVGISLDGKHQDWKTATEKYDIKWPQFSNLKVWDEPAARAYGVMGIPHTVLLDKDGTIIEKNLRGDAIAEKLEELLSK